MNEFGVVLDFGVYIYIITYIIYMIYMGCL